jgi:hypothetical protein
MGLGWDRAGRPAPPAHWSRVELAIEEWWVVGYMRCRLVEPDADYFCVPLGLQMDGLFLFFFFLFYTHTQPKRWTGKKKLIKYYYIINYIIFDFL